MTRRDCFAHIIKPLLFIACLLPLGWLSFSDLGANPVERLTHTTGEWALRLLLVTLSMTPLCRFTGWGEWSLLRRMFGLFAFFYATLHLLVYLVIDQGLLLEAIVEDVLKRPYITLGLTAFIGLIPLATTSSKRMVRRLGGERWRLLHGLVYPVSLLAVLHFIWLTKADYREPLSYLAILLLLLVLRFRKGVSG